MERTEREWRRLEDELATARRIVEEVAHERMDSVRMGSFVIRDNVDGSQDCLFVSDRTLEIVGRNREEIMENFQMVFAQAHPEDFAGLIALDAEVTRTKMPFRWEGRMIVEGEVRWLNVEAVPRPMADGTTIWDAVVLDITTRKLAEENLGEALREEQRKRAEIEQLSRAKSRFLASVSHEIRTPLTALVSLSHGLIAEAQKCALPESFTEYIYQVRAGGHYLNQILTNLLDLTSIESGHAPVQAEAFYLADWLDDLRAIVEPLAQSHGARVDWSLPEDAELQWCTDHTRLTQIVLNLSHNALKFADQPGATVAIRIGCDGHRLSATVSDEGPGLDASILPKLFEEYVQMPLQKPQLNRGIGLGLAIVRENTRLLGGTIEATANAPRGLRFQLSLPRMQPTQRQGF